MILAEFEDYIYCCTHLSLTEEDRMKSSEELLEAGGSNPALIEKIFDLHVIMLFVPQASILPIFKVSGELL